MEQFKVFRAFLVPSYATLGFMLALSNISLGRQAEDKDSMSLLFLLPPIRKFLLMSGILLPRHGSLPKITCSAAQKIHTKRIFPNTPD
jgi:hypothetical protein